ncbi:hypothetical protein CJ030_MR7G008113 [Morella rubra]|uniref:WAT1-related protein n=1 Tax=Morella rubra TaxID=262757 RepID=A0A6A1V2X8_9ROSI|nr:hypothetical protein CJ030_MR7G008113 [Morella rubra]
MDVIRLASTLVGSTRPSLVILANFQHLLSYLGVPSGITLGDTPATFRLHSSDFPTSLRRPFLHHSNDFPALSFFLELFFVVVQLSFAGVNVFYKLAANDGMSLSIIIAYRFIFATAFVIPLALLIERLERLNLGSISGKAKVLGTVIGMGGAMLLTFYKGADTRGNTRFSHAGNGKKVLFSEPKEKRLVFRGKEKDDEESFDMASVKDMSKVLLLKDPASKERKLEEMERHQCILNACEAVANMRAEVDLRAKMSETYPCHYSSTALMCMMGAIQAAVFALCMERDWSQWKLGWNIRRLAVSYSHTRSRLDCVRSIRSAVGQRQRDEEDNSTSTPSKSFRESELTDIVITPPMDDDDDKKKDITENIEPESLPNSNAPTDPGNS